MPIIGAALPISGIANRCSNTAKVANQTGARRERNMVNAGLR